MAINISQPSVWNYSKTNIVDSDGALIKVRYTSLCRTDLDVIDGSLKYYQTGKAQYPIVPGHEWCGEYEGQPVVGLCILGCQQCKKCSKAESYCSSRREVGVVNKNGSHAEYLCLAENRLLTIPTFESCYALVEPIAVVIHGLQKIQLNSFSRILILGYGSIGKICERLIRIFKSSSSLDIYDPKYHNKEIDFCQYDLVIECSGAVSALSRLYNLYGTILAFGLKYEPVDIGQLVANDSVFIGSLGSNLDDFQKAIEVAPQLQLPTLRMKLSEYQKGIIATRKSKKVIFDLV